MRTPRRTRPCTTRRESFSRQWRTVRRVARAGLDPDNEPGDETSLALWRKFRELSITKYRETYARLNIHFDVYSGESTVSRDAQEAALKSLLASGHVEESNGALVVDLTAFKLAKTVVRKKDGTYVYITRDIAGAAERWEQYGFDKMIYVVATQQDLHMAQVRPRPPPPPPSPD